MLFFHFLFIYRQSLEGVDKYLYKFHRTVASLAWIIMFFLYIILTSWTLQFISYWTKPVQDARVRQLCFNHTLEMDDRCRRPLRTELLLCHLVSDKLSETKHQISGA